ncbi:hypothetical protein [Bacillus cereus group sp. BfR-BA-01380]|uniref:hypothetical protein n=1 Tax=Bacillus cereus group sp. BfR-BA-01380 TaxID=2920324 RepID=UPI001F58F2E3|nr:hypothetical protein [Bacillus cereus group sp. BfR-BA-01380]
MEQKIEELVERLQTKVKGANVKGFIPLFVGSNTPTSKFSESIVQFQWLECSVASLLPAR